MKLEVGVLLDIVDLSIDNNDIAGKEILLYIPDSFESNNLSQKRLYNNNLDIKIV